MNYSDNFLFCKKCTCMSYGAVNYCVALASLKVEPSPFPRKGLVLTVHACTEVFGNLAKTSTSISAHAQNFTLKMNGKFCACVLKLDVEFFCKIPQNLCNWSMDEHAYLIAHAKNSVYQALV